MPAYPCPRCSTPNYGKPGTSFRCSRCYQTFTTDAAGEAPVVPGPQVVNLGCASLIGIAFAVAAGAFIAAFASGFVTGLARR